MQISRFQPIAPRPAFSGKSFVAGRHDLASLVGKISREEMKLRDQEQNFVVNGVMDVENETLGTSQTCSYLATGDDAVFLRAFTNLRDSPETTPQEKRWLGELIYNYFLPSQTKE